MNNFGSLKQEYLDGLFLAKPHLATFMGDHRFDDRWADLSSRGVELRVRVLQQQQLRLASIDKNRLSLEDQVDQQILANAIALEMLYLTEIREWETDPRLHDSFPFYDPREMVATRLADIMHGNFASAGQRLKSLDALLQKLPDFVSQFQQRLRNPSKVYTEQAIADNRGRVELLCGEVAAFVKSADEASEGDRNHAESARRSATKALEDYQSFLENELLPRSTGNWRLGAERYRKKFPLALETVVKPEALATRAREAFDRVNEELYEVTLQLHAELFPGRPHPTLQTNAAQKLATILQVRDALSKDHPQPERLVEAHRRNLDEFRSFIEKQNLLALPPADTLRVEPMPLYKRGVAAAEYLAPGILENSPHWTATYFVDPIDPTWSADRIESYLRGNNNYETRLTAMHEAYPGHHTQFYYARKNPNPLRAVLWNAPFVEGWAVYGTRLMTRLGYGEAQNLRYRFFDLRGQLIVATNTLIDIGLHGGDMTEGEALRFMTEEGLQERAQAEKKLLRAKLDTTQLVQYFLGLDEILQLESEMRKRDGAAFRQREFDEKLISHGSIAVKHLRRYLFPE